MVKEVKVLFQKTITQKFLLVMQAWNWRVHILGSHFDYASMFSESPLRSSILSITSVATSKDADCELGHSQCLQELTRHAPTSCV